MLVDAPESLHFGPFPLRIVGAHVCARRVRMCAQMVGELELKRLGGGQTKWLSGESRSVVKDTTANTHGLGWCNCRRQAAIPMSSLSLSLTSSPFTFLQPQLLFLAPLIPAAQIFISLTSLTLKQTVTQSFRHKAFNRPIRCLRVFVTNQSTNGQKKKRGGL